MNRTEFQLLVERAVGEIPREFLARVENLTFQVEDWADEMTLEEVGLDDPRDLLGFYRGWPLSERTHDYGSCLPDVIIIYQRAVESHFRETGVPLSRVIRETIIHELAHYFGFSEEEMDEIETLWAEENGAGGGRES
jgi:predicted Zn-dependent protease with MMP-like domain